MAVLLGYAAGKAGLSALRLAAGFAAARGEDLEIVHVETRPWYEVAEGDQEWRTQSRDAEIDRALDALRQLDEEGASAPGADVVARTHHAQARSGAGSLLAAIDNLRPSMVVLGSGATGGLGQVALGATANKLMHASPVPVAVAPRGYRPGPLRRLVAAWSSADEPRLLGEMATFGRDAGMAVRAVTFGRRGPTMYPPEVGLHAEHDVFDGWREESLTALRATAPGAGLDPDSDVELVIGKDWRDAVEEVDWRDGDILAMGSHGSGPLRRVFLGSSAARLLRHSPAPVLVFPG